jgi:hypothetical protein
MTARARLPYQSLPAGDARAAVPARPCADRLAKIDGSAGRVKQKIRAPGVCPIARLRIAALARPSEWIEDRGDESQCHETNVMRPSGMRPSVKSITASICLCWAAYCGPYDSNAWPLAFGMTPQEASTALGMPLTYYSGPPGSAIYLAGGPAGVPGRFPVDAAITLQFRRGHLTGWKNNWSLPRPWIIY